MAVPFTTPLLAQARIRAARPGALELVLSNPSGGRGSYILGVGSLGEVARLTVHDRLLLERLGTLPELSPAAVRLAAREIAATGSAGREAAHAAAEAVAREASERTVAGAVLMAGLLRHAGPLHHAGLAEVDSRRLDPADPSSREDVGRLLAKLAPGMGMSPAAIRLAIDEIAEVVRPVGFRSCPFDSGVVQAVEALERFAVEVRDWGRLEPEDRRAGIELIAACAAGTLSRARACLDRVWTTLDAVPHLVRRWASDRPAITAYLTRPDWLVDGWPYICASWDQATSEDRSAQRSALARIESLVPPLPAETAGETAPPGSAHERLYQRRWLRPREDLRSAATAALLVGRNEALRAALP